MHYPDLSNECQIARGPRVRAVGWLDAENEYDRGAVDARVVEALRRLAEEGWIHVAVAGPHLCELCGGARESRNILVPARDVLYAAPAMIVHYMADHSYLPPPEFSTAVLSCPEPTTDAYYAELRRFVDVFSMGGRPMSTEDFDRSARKHREWRAEHAAARIAEQARKRFTWD